MRKILLVLFILVSKNTFAQFCSQSNYDFDALLGAECDTLWIDSAATGNIWQVGVPAKTVFTAAHSDTNVIVTDTLNPYPVNNTSTFYWRQQLGTFFYSCYLSGWYNADMDSLNDYGQIHILKDTGSNWIEITGMTMGSQPPTLTGNSGGWKYFSYDLYTVIQAYNFQPNDSITFRFTFKSDSVFDNRDGLMYDDLFYQNLIPENTSQLNSLTNEFVAYPNITHNQTYIHYSLVSDEKINCMLYDVQGKLLQQLITNETRTAGKHDETLLLPSDLCAGNYLLRFSANGKTTSARIVLQ